MKLNLIVIAVAALSFASCKKDRVCECKTQYDIPGIGSTFETDVYTLKDVSKITANRACIHKEWEEIENGQKTRIDIYCQLK